MKNKNISNKNEKTTNFLNMLFTTLFQGRNGSLKTSTTREFEYTLIPRVMNNDVVVFTIHVDLHMDVSQRQPPRVYCHAERAGNNHPNNSMDDLHYAASNGNVTRVQDLVRSKKELIGHKDSQGNLPLHLAVKKGHKEVALHLISEFPQGSYALNKFGKSPIYLATAKGYIELVENMLECLARDGNATTRLKEGRSIIFAAITAQSQEMVQIILRHQPKLIKSTNEQGWTPLSCAAYNGLVDIVKFFLETCPDLVHNDFSYPIHKACLGGHVRVLKMFYAHSPKFFTKPDQNGLTILHLAAKEPHNKLKIECGLIPVELERASKTCQNER